MRKFAGPLPFHMQSLPVDKRGFPVPAFVCWFDGVPDFRVMDPRHLRRCIRQDRCWICGAGLNRFKVFTIGPMCCINRISSEPPSHYECAAFAAVNCPFLAHPLAKRGDLGDLEPQAAGRMIERNPGCCALWITRSYQTFDANGVLFEIGDPVRIEFYANGRKATRAEIDQSIVTGLPFLEEAAALDGDDGLAELDQYKARFQPLLERFSA
jgi:hypothetical protein